MDKKTQMHFNLNNFAIALSTLLDEREKTEYNITENHSKRVAFTSLKIALNLGFEDKELNDLSAFALLHNISLKDKQSKDTYIKNSISIIKDYNLEVEFKDSFFSIIEFVDYLDYTFDLSNKSIDNRFKIIEYVKNLENKNLENIKNSFLEITQDLSFWLDIQNENVILHFIYKTLGDFTEELIFEDVLEIAASLLDDISLIQKCSLISDYYQFEHKDKYKFLIASALCNIGKLKINNNILQKKSSLNSIEYEEIKSYPYYTIKALSNIMEFADIALMAGRVGERLDASGYPNRLLSKDLSLKDRVLSNIHIYDSLTKKRSYRDSYTHEEAISIMKEMNKNYKIDGAIIEDIDELFN